MSEDVLFEPQVAIVASWQMKSCIIIIDLRFRVQISIQTNGWTADVPLSNPKKLQGEKQVKRIFSLGIN